MRTLVFLGVGVVTAALVKSVAAAPWEPKAKPARILLAQGADASDAGDFMRAASLSLRSLDEEPSLIAHWNAGQAFAAAGSWRRAVEQYDFALMDRALPRAQRARIEPRRHIALAFLEADSAAAANRFDEARAAYLAILEEPGLYPLDRQHAITGLDRTAQKRAAAETPAAPAVESESATTPNRPPRGASKPTPTNPATVDESIEPSRPSRFSDGTALILTGVGLVVVGVGTSLYWQASALEDDASTPTTSETERANLRDRAESERIAAPFVLAAGGVLAISGLVKLAIPESHPHSPNAALRPTSGGAMFVLGGRF